MLQSGESGSRTDITLPEPQKQLLHEIKALDKKIVLVLFNGRPLALTDIIEDCDAILEAWFPGTAGGLSICDCLFGDYNPSGRLTVSFPYHVGQEPLYYSQFATGRPDQNDLTVLSDFVRKIKEKDNNSIKSDHLPVHVPGNRPYREYGTIPLIPGASHTCGSCGLCAAKCPSGAIPSDNPTQTDKDKCISCMRCISVCPTHSRKLNPLMLAAASQKLKKACSGRKENELFL